jgi:hypothetical protein
MKTFYKDKINVPVKDNADRVIFVDAIVEFYTDKNFGADMDNNRGITRVFIKDIIFNSIKENDALITFESLSKEIQDYIETDITENFYIYEKV